MMTDDEFIPSTNLVAMAYVGTIAEARGDEPAIRSEFERWLAKVRSEAWEEGFSAGEEDVLDHEHTSWSESCTRINPYRSHT